MKYLRLFENFKLNEHNVGDMVYVDAYGPKTYNFSDNNGQTSGSVPFRPKVYNFDKDTKYEIISIDNGDVTVFDEDNNPIEISSNSIFSNRIQTQYIKDCLVSSFEDILDINNLEYIEYVNELIININEQVNRVEFEDIFKNEFKPRLESDGFETFSKFISTKLQIYVYKK